MKKSTLGLWFALFHGAIVHVALADNLTRLGQPAELTIRASGAHSVRVTLKSVVTGEQALANPTLVDRVWPEPDIRLQAITETISKRVGGLEVKVSASPLTVAVSDARGNLLQSLVFDSASGNVSFLIGNSPILGMGEGGKTFDRRGNLDPMTPAWGSGTIGSRNPVALLIGTGGWGLYLAAPLTEVPAPQGQPQTPRLQVDLRGPERGIFVIPDQPKEQAAGLFDCFVFDTHDPAVFMKEVSVLTGPAVMPPKWALGYMQSHRTLQTDKEMIGVVDTFREKKLPIDAVIYLGTGFAPVGWNTPQPSLTFNPKVFLRDPAEVLADLHKDNVKVIVHVVPPTLRQLPALHGSIPAAGGEAVDATHILTYWQKHIDTFNTGVDAWWPDEGDPFALPSRLERQKMYYQGPLLTRPDLRPWSLNRNGHLGSAQWGAWIWSGDTQSQWGTLRDQVMVGLNESLSLSPYWGSDTGGFYVTRELTGELYARWFEFSAFCPLFRSHGRTWQLHLPWGWATGSTGPVEDPGPSPVNPTELHNAEVEPICREYLNLRYQLLPYNYTLAREAFDTGMPFMRALWLHYPDDPKAVGLSNEYLWGRDLLIAPVVTKGAMSRDVYLPKGDWYDWWTNEKTSGGQSITRTVDLKTMPIYVRAGAIIPFDPVRQYTAEKVTEPTTLKIYRGADGQFTLYDDDGITQAYLKNQGTWTKLSWNDGAKTLTIEPGAPKGVAGIASPRTFKVELLPDGIAKTVNYDGKQGEVAF